MRLGANTIIGGALFAHRSPGRRARAVDRPHRPGDGRQPDDRRGAARPRILVRHRRARPRHLLARRARRADLAHGRRLRPADQLGDRHRARPERRVFRRLVGRFRHRPHQPVARDPVADLRARHHGDPRARPHLAADRARADQLVVHLPARARLGAVAQVAGLRAGLARARLWRRAHHGDAAAAQHARAADRDRDARHGRHDPGRGRALVPRARRPSALSELGQHAVGGARPDHHRALALGLPRARDLPHRARPQPAWATACATSSIRNRGAGAYDAAVGQGPADRPCDG